MRGAASSCTSRIRELEQRCPALWNAEASVSATTCSGSAEESTTIAFNPPVSAMNGTIGPSRAASAWLIARAVSYEPVNTTPATSGCRTSGAPTASPVPGTSCSTSRGTPASCSSATARAAISGVCSAGFATTALPAISAAVTWPVKIASGKFQGLMQAKTPRPASASEFASPVGPGSASGAPKSARPRAA